MSKGLKKYLEENPDVVKTVNEMAMKTGSTFDDIAKEISEFLGDINVKGDTIRKYTRDVLGRKTDQSRNCFKNKNFETSEITHCESNCEDDLIKEKIKLQTLNLERNKLNRNEARKELFYEQISNVITTLPLPEFVSIDESFKDEFNKEYLLCLADIHYGATFKSENNEYSREIVKSRLEFLQDRIIAWCNEHNVCHLHIASIGDLLQGVLRISDLQINDTSVVQCVVEISRLIAMFLNSLSRYITIDYYHVTSANHTQTRPIGTKASELANEDLEYVIGNYIKDLVANNERINIHLPEDNKNYLNIDILGFNIILTHGHTIKNISSSIKDLTIMRREFIDYLIMGHFHGGKEMTSSEGVCNDCEVLVCPSFIGSDPYSDTLFKGSKGSVKIFGFDEIFGHTETYKFILN